MIAQLKVKKGEFVRDVSSITISPVIDPLIPLELYPKGQVLTL